MCGRIACTVRREGTGNGAEMVRVTGDGRPWETMGMSAGPKVCNGYRASSLPYHHHGNDRDMYSITISK